MDFGRWSYRETSTNNGFRILRKTDMRLMPYTALIYLLCYLDRSNIGMTPAQSKPLDIH